MLRLPRKLFRNCSLVLCLPVHKEFYLYMFHSKKNAGSNVLNFIFIYFFGQAIESEMKNLYILIFCFMLGFNFHLRNLVVNGN